MIALVTDSTCDLPEDILKEHQVEVVPLTVHFGDDTYYDKIDLKSEEFYKMMEESSELPTTSQPSVGLFLDKYKKLTEEYNQIISIHLSSSLSGTCEAAKLAASQTGEAEIEVIDSKATSTGLGFLVLLAAKMIEKGKDLNEIKSKIMQERDNLTIYFTVNELSYLEQGGRIGKTQAFLGNIFNFNPILELSSETGEIIAKEKIRGYKKTNKRLIELALEATRDSKNINFAYLYGKNSDNFKQFQDFFEKELNEQNRFKYNLISNRIGSVLTSHTGPLVYGIVIYRGELLE